MAEFPFGLISFPHFVYVFFYMDDKLLISADAPGKRRIITAVLTLKQTVFFPKFGHLEGDLFNYIPLQSQIDRWLQLT